MGRRLIIAACVVALVPIAPAAAQGAAAPRELMPGVTYERRIEFTSYGPVAVNVITAPRPGGLISVRVALSNESILGREKLTDMQKRLASTATVAGVNGDFFNVGTGKPSGVVIRDGALEHPPLGGRSSVGFDTGGALRVDRVTMLATWQGTGPRRAVSEINGPAGTNGVALFTSAWGGATPVSPGSAEAVLGALPATTPNTELSATVTQVAAGGGTAIPPGGAVLVAKGSAAARLQAEAAAGQAVRLRLILKPAWSGVTAALGGGPLLVKNGQAVFSANEQLTDVQLHPRGPRTAVGQTADGRVLLVAVDGRQPGISLGVTTFDLALLMVRLGATTAAAFDSGGSTAMAADGRLLSRPSDGGERAIADALLVAYSGVYVPPPAVAVVSPNGDGIGERQLLAYRLVRPSQTTVALVGPDGVPRLATSGLVQPGSYPLDWSAQRPDGTPEAEGGWRWTVTATDDLGQSSSSERSFSVNRTLGFPRAVPPALAVPRASARVVASFALTRAATVTARIETISGDVLALQPKRRLGAGSFEVAWDGVTDGRAVVFGGRYVARVIAENEVGSVELTATFTVRRTPAQAPPAGRPAG